MKEIVYTNKWFSVMKDEQWHYINEFNVNNGAVILILKENKKFILVKNYRKAIDSIVIELPRGYGEVGETSLLTAIRESYEETGYLIKEGNIQKIGSVNPNSAILSSEVDVFFAHVANEDLIKKHDKEVIELIEINKNNILHEILSGTIHDAFTLSAISLYIALKCDISLD